MHLNSIKVFKKYAQSLIKSSDSVLEIGPDTVPSTYRKIVALDLAKWETMDFAGRTDVSIDHKMNDPYLFPIADEVYDVILAGQVCEHVGKLWRWFAELNRICKKGGTIILITPITHRYHLAPIDCWRIYPDAYKALCEDFGFDIILCDWINETFPPFKAIKRKPLAQRFSETLNLPFSIFRLPLDASFDCILVAKKI